MSTVLHSIRSSWQQRDERPEGIEALPRHIEQRPCRHCRGRVSEEEEEK
jgi:hypothetical protein